MNSGEHERIPHENDKDDPKKCGIPNDDYLTDAFAKRLPYSLATPFWNCNTLVQGWREACESIECDNISADFAFVLFQMEKLLFGAAGLAMLWGSDELPPDEPEHGAVAAVNYVADEFAAVADGVVRWRFFREASVHQLVVHACQGWQVHIQASLDETDERRSWRPCLHPAATLKRHSKMLKKIMLGEYYLGPKSTAVFEARLFQEVSRAYDQRFLTKRSYPCDNRPYDLRSFSRFSPSERAILDVITEGGKRMVTKEVLNALYKRNGTASIGTTKSTLAGLVRNRHLTTQSDSHGKGYGLPEWD